MRCDEILHFAHRDAEAAYDNLSGYRITMLLKPDVWHVDYDLTGEFVAGSGPHYAIDPVTGSILSKRYEQ